MIFIAAPTTTTTTTNITAITAANDHNLNQFIKHLV